MAEKWLPKTPLRDMTTKYNAMVDELDTKANLDMDNKLKREELPTMYKSDLSDFPTKLSEFLNDLSYQTLEQVDSAIAAIVDSSPETLNTLNELAAALGDDPNFATTMATELGNRELLIKNAASKTTLADNDTIPLSDSSNSNTTKKITVALLKSIFLPLASATVKGGVKIGEGLQVVDEKLNVINQLSSQPAAPLTNIPASMSPEFTGTTNN